MSALQIENGQAFVEGWATSWCQAVWGDEIHIALVVQDRQQLGNHESVLEGPIPQAGQQRSPRVEACCAQLHPGNRGGHQQLVTECGGEKEAVGQPAGRKQLSSPPPTGHQGGPRSQSLFPTCRARGVL